MGHLWIVWQVGKPFVILFRGRVGWVSMLVIFLFPTIFAACDPPPSTQTTPTVMPPPQMPATMPEIGGGPLDVPFSLITPSPKESSSLSGSGENFMQERPKLLIVVDRSKSMVVDCREYNPEKIYAEIIYFLSILLQEKADIYIVPLPEKEETINLYDIPESKDKIVEMLAKDERKNNNDYLAALKNIKSQYNDAVVLLLSDGAFNAPRYTRMRDDVAGWLRKQEEGESDFLNRLYMMQANCPSIYNEDEYKKDKLMWEDRLLDGHYRLVDLTEDVSNGLEAGSFLRKLIEETNLKKALPEGGQWAEDAGGMVPGYTDKIYVTVWALQWRGKDAQVRFSVSDERAKIEKMPIGEETEIDIKAPKPKGETQPACSQIQYNFLRTDAMPLIYYVLKPHFVHEDLVLSYGKVEPSGDSIKDILQSPGEEGFSLWNKPSFTFDIRGRYSVPGGLDDSLLKKYKECYSVYVKVRDGDGDSLLNKRIDFPGGAWSNEFSLILSEDDIKKIFSNLNSPTDLYFILSIKALKDDIFYEVKTWQSAKIPVRFYPVVELAKDIEYNEENNKKQEANLSLTGDFWECRFYSLKECTDGKALPLSLYVYVSDVNKSKECTSNTSDWKESLPVFGVDGGIDVLTIDETHNNGTQGSATPMSITSKNVGGVKIQIRDYEEYLSCGYMYLLIYVDESIPAYVCNVDTEECMRADLWYSELAESQLGMSQ